MVGICAPPSTTARMSPDPQSTTTISTGVHSKLLAERKRKQPTPRLASGADAKMINAQLGGTRGVATTAEGGSPDPRQKRAAQPPTQSPLQPNGHTGQQGRKAQQSVPMQKLPLQQAIHKQQEQIAQNRQQQQKRRKNQHNKLTDPQGQQQQPQREVVNGRTGPLNAVAAVVDAAPVVNAGQRVSDVVSEMESLVVEAAGSAPAAGLAPAAVPVNDRVKNIITDVRFDSFALSRPSLKSIHELFGFQQCTKVQAETLPPILAGVDVLSKAKTGSGKTIAFLLPAIEKILAQGAAKRGSPSPFHVLVLCPTRELASQVGGEAKQLLQYHAGIGVQVVFGGTGKSGELQRLKSQPCQIMVATPGRLLDHLQNSPGIAQQLQGLQVLVFDEADQMLDMGFKPAIDKILRFVPATRQTLLFSATLPKTVETMASRVLRKGYAYVDVVGEEEADTNIQVKQESLIVPMEAQVGALFSLIMTHREEEDNFKVLVFATTANGTALLASLFSKLPGVGAVLEIHSRKSQSYRTRVSDEFREHKGGVVMFTSDVSARGVDYPDVTMVVQLGMPSETAQYVHRLGRTGRAGKEGRGVLMLAPWEGGFLRKLADLPITPSQTPKPLTTQQLNQLAKAIHGTDKTAKSKAYVAWLGYYKSNMRLMKWSSEQLVEVGNHYALTIGLTEPPVLSKQLVSKMGLRGVKGIRTE